MPTHPGDLSRLQRKIWNGLIPLEIRLANKDCRTYDDSDPYLIQYQRLAYLPLLLPRLHAFFSPSLINPNVSLSEGWFSFENVPLKWHYPVGLLYDLFSGAEPRHANGRSAPNSKVRGGDGNGDDEPESSMPEPLPWKIVLHFTDWPKDQLITLDPLEKVLHDAFQNAVKEADFLRNGTAKAVMSLSKDDSTQLWRSVEIQSLLLFNPINNKLLNPPGTPLRNVPLKIYLPTSAPTTESSETMKPGHLRVVQAPITPQLPSRQPQTVGTALNSLLPSLFPSRRSPLLAQPVLHGSVLPLSAPVEDLMRSATYADGWLHLAVVMMG